MTVNENVLQLIRNIEQGIKDEKPIRWADLTPEDRDYLFNQAQNDWADNRKGVELLQVVYKIIDTDIPNKIKLLQLFYVRRDTPSKSKTKVLENIKTELGNLRASAKNADQFNLYSGDYYLLLARNKEDSGNLERTLAEYQASIEYYKKAGAYDREARVQQEVEQLKLRKEQKDKPLPIEILISQRGQLEADMAELETRFVQVKLQTESAQQYLMEFDQEQIELKKIKTEIEQLRQKYPSTRLILEFMLALPQAANAPLWVEVLRLALQQGEMDEFSKQALERLAIVHPQEAIPLLAEIAARAPEPFKIEKQQAQMGMTQWFLLIAQARQEMNSENHLKAAEIMVKAWETFFALKAKNNL